VPLSGAGQTKQADLLLFIASFIYT